LLTHHQTRIKFILLKMEMKCFSIRVA
jgi:hypothetical protein